MSDGVSSVAEAAQVVANAGFERFAHAADIHAEYRCGSATVFVRDDLCGQITVLVRCPAWSGDIRLPAGVSLGLLAFVVGAARDEARFHVENAS